MVIYRDTRISTGAELELTCIVSFHVILCLYRDQDTPIHISVYIAVLRQLLVEWRVFQQLM